MMALLMPVISSGPSPQSFDLQLYYFHFFMGSSIVFFFVSAIKVCPSSLNKFFLSPFFFLSE